MTIVIAKSNTQMSLDSNWDNFNPSTDLVRSSPPIDPWKIATDWLQKSGDKKGKLPARYKRYIALASVVSASAASLSLLEQGLISNTASSFHGRLIKAELSEHAKLKQLSALSTYIAAGLTFDYLVLGRSITSPATFVTTTLGIDSMTKQLALYAKKWIKPDKGESPSLLKRYGALIAAETATVASGHFMGQGIVTMTASLFLGRLVKAETKDFSSRSKISALALYTIFSVSVDLGLLTLLQQPVNQPSQWIAASVALSISLKLMAELTQKWMNPCMKTPRLSINHPEPLNLIDSTISSEGVLYNETINSTVRTGELGDHDLIDALKIDESRESLLPQNPTDSTNKGNFLTRSWNWLRGEDEETRPSPLVRYGSIATTTIATVASITCLEQGLISKTCGMFQGRLLKSEISSSFWTKKRQYAFLVGFTATALLVDTVILRRSIFDPANFVLATMALNLLVKIAGIDAQRLMNPNFIDDEDEDDAPPQPVQNTTAPENPKKNKSKKKKIEKAETLSLLEFN